jgi:hypothetical protein
MFDLPNLFTIRDTLKSRIADKSVNVDDKDVSALGFISAMIVSLECVLQDSVFLRKEFPLHPVWKHPVRPKAKLLFCATTISMWKSAYNNKNNSCRCLLM